MFGNCDEKTVTPNRWTQSEIDDHHKVSMASNGSTRVMEKPGQDLVQQQQQALRCPRCDSSNTKFCYYNNYSLSQPRHFCKACKRYWTRGGTLRNVPVGGGCRKNKRVKRSSTTHSSNSIDNNTNTIVASPSSSSNPTSANSNPPSQLHNFDIANSTSNHINTLLYGAGNGSNSCHDVMNFPFSTRFNSRVVSSSSSGYDHLQVNGLGLGFSSGLLMSGSGGEINHHYHDAGYNRNGFSSNNNNNHTLVSSYNSIFGSSSTSTNSLTSTPVMTSLLSSTLLQQKFMSSTGTGGGMKGDIFHHEMKMEGNSSSEVAGIMASKEVKLCEGQNRLQEWNHVNANGAVAFQNQMEHLGLSDTSNLYWNNHNSSNTATGLGVWSDQPNNIGPSVTSLI